MLEGVDDCLPGWSKHTPEHDVIKVMIWVYLPSLGLFLLL